MLLTVHLLYGLYFLMMTGKRRKFRHNHMQEGIMKEQKVEKELRQEQNAYERPVTLRNIMRFAFPTIAMSLFMSFYTMVDGLFVSNLIGTSALSAINLTAPVISFVTAVSTMLATGGSAVIMKKMGEGKDREAREDFTFLILVNVIVGAVMCAMGYLCMDLMFSQMHLSVEVKVYCTQYLGWYLLFTIPILLMNNFSLYLIACGKSSLSFICSVGGGITNIVLDYLLIRFAGMGVGGAAIATGAGYSVTAVVGIFVFAGKKSLLHFQKPVWRPNVLKRAAGNGCSEMATALVTGITTLIFNWTMLKYVGEDGVAAITIIMYVLMFVSSLFSGYSYGVAPMISYYYGAQEQKKLRKVIRTSLKIITVISITAVGVSIGITRPLVSVFTRPENPVYTLAVTGNRICSIALLFIGFNIFASGMFTALNNGVVSAALAFSRSFVFMLACLLLLPLLFGVTGIWLANPLAELLAVGLAAVMFWKYRERYRY